MRLASSCPWSILLFLGIAGAASAHLGHGTTDHHAVLHYVAEPLHVVPLLVMLAAAVGISLLAARRRTR